MKLTIIAEDGFVSIDGIGKNLDLTGLIDGNIHAVQWSGLKGVVEQVEGGPRAIQDLLEFQDVIDLFNAPDPVPDQPTLPQAISAKLDALATYRYARETGGFVYGGQTILTDDRSKTLLAGARTAADKAIAYNQSYEINWKSSNGWIVLDAFTIVTLSDAVRTFVQACFDTEKFHYEAISALETVEAVAAYDFTIGWPQ